MRQGVLFACETTNPSDTCAGISDNLIDCASSGIGYEAHRTSRGWNATLELPFALIANPSPSKSDDPFAAPAPSPADARAVPTDWLLNYFRIDQPSGQVRSLRSRAASF